MACVLTALIRMNQHLFWDYAAIQPSACVQTMSFVIRDQYGPADNFCVRTDQQITQDTASLRGSLCVMRPLPNAHPATSD